MTVLLAAEQVELYPPGPAEGTGWATAPPAPLGSPSWTGLGNLQLSSGSSDPRAAEGGGYGPFAPNRAEVGTLFLPPDAEPAEGTTALVRGVRWVLSQCRLVLDPTGGALSCWEATATRDTQLDPADA